MICKSCGKHLPASAKFCSGCGAGQNVPLPNQNDTPLTEQNDISQTNEQPAPPPTTPVYGQPTPQPPHDAYGQPPVSQPPSPAYGQPMPQPPSPAYGQPMSQPPSPAYGQPPAPQSPPSPAYGQPAPQPPPAYGSPEAPGYQSQYPPAEEKNGLWWKILIPTAAIAAIVAIVFIVIIGGSPERSLERAVANLEDEISERYRHSPLVVLEMIANSMEDGTTSLVLEHRDTIWNEHTQIRMDMKSDFNAGEYAVLFDIRFDDFNFDFDFYINSDRIAMRSRSISDDFFGFYFDTFADDIQELAGLFEIFGGDLSELTDTIDMLQELFTVEDNLDEQMEKFNSIIDDFVENLESSSENTRIEVNGRTVNATRIYYVISSNDIVDFLHNLAAWYEDVLFSSINSFNNPMLQDPFFDEQFELDGMMFDITYMINEISRSVDGDVTISFYVGNRDRLHRIKIDADLEADTERTEMNITLDFGSSVTDRWEFDISVRNGLTDYGINIAWDFEERDNAHVNNFIISVTEGIYTDVLILSSSWNMENGDFNLSFRGPFGVISESVSGNLIIEDNNYTLKIYDIELGWGEVMSIEISGQPGGANIDQIDFINIDLWFESVFDAYSILDYFLDFFLDGIDALIDPPIIPPPPINGQVTDVLVIDELIGTWVFESGVYVYFFGHYTEIEFFPDGTITEDMSNWTARFIAIGNGTFTLSVNCCIPDCVFVFYYLLIYDTLFIVDEDDDMAVFVRVN